MTDVSVGFLPPCWCPFRWTPARRLLTNLFKSGKKFLRISSTRKISVTWIWARVFVYLHSFFSQILDFIYWTVLTFILIYSEWSDTENQQLLAGAYPRRRRRWSRAWWRPYSGWKVDRDTKPWFIACIFYILGIRVIVNWQNRVWRFLTAG